MPATVYASTGGRKYHLDQACKTFENAQQLNDTDCCCGDYCTHRMPLMHALVRMSSTKAAIDRKLPCLACVPAHLRELPEADSFGHGPVDEYEGTPEGSRGLTHIVCARCMTWTRWRDVDLSVGIRVAWPCASAIVLALVPRPALAVGER